VSNPASFSNTAAATVGLWEKWLEQACEWTHHVQMPSPIELQTICRETGFVLADLESFARSRDLPPVLLLLGGGADWARDVGAVLGYSSEPPEIPDAPVAWMTQGGSIAAVKLRHGHATRDVSRKAMLSMLSGDLVRDDLLLIEEHVAGPQAWSLCWIPHPAHCARVGERPAEMDLWLAQRAAVAVSEDAPAHLRETLEEMGQKLWLTRRDDLASPDDRQRLLDELATLLGDRDEELDIRASAAWMWVAARLLEQTEDKKRSFQHALSHYELKLASSNHLLGEYRTHWIGGVRTLVEGYVQGRLTCPAMAALFDVQKSGPTVESYLAALSLPALWKKLNEHVTDRMAEFVSGLAGLATKLNLQRIPLGDVDVKWDPRTLGPRLERILVEKQIFPSGGGKRGGLVSKVTGRKQAMLDERKGQVARGTRLTVQFIETEFAAWARTLMSAMTERINIQLSAALVNEGYPDPDGLRAALPGFERLEAAIRGRRESARSPEAVTAEWLQQLAAARWIPRYHAA